MLSFSHFIDLVKDIKVSGYGSMTCIVLPRKNMNKTTAVRSEILTKKETQSNKHAKIENWLK